MDSPAVVEAELLAEDWAAIRDALWAVGRDSKADLGWLLEQGLDRFVQDEAEWKTLDGRTDGVSESRRQELKRRETEALLVSMRASTIAAEVLMHELGDRVHVLGAEMKAHSRKMWPLRKENDELEARLRASGDSGNGSKQAPAESRTLRERLQDLVKRWRER